MVNKLNGEEAINYLYSCSSREVEVEKSGSSIANIFINGELFLILFCITQH